MIYTIIHFHTMVAAPKMVYSSFAVNYFLKDVIPILKCFSHMGVPPAF